MAYLVLKGADQNKYGSILKQMVTQYSMGNDQYPKTLEVAVDVLTEHRFDPKFGEIRKANKHKEWEKNDHESKATSFAQKKLTGNQGKEIICHCCGKKGHIAPKCSKKDEIPKNEWHINRACSMLAEAEANKGSDDESTRSKATTRTAR